MAFERLGKWVRTVAAGLALVLAGPQASSAGVPLRVSVKFILGEDGRRADIGWFVLDEDVRAAVATSNELLHGTGSELRIDLLEIVDVAGASQFFTRDLSGDMRDDLRSAAKNDPARYGWRDDAVNVFITGDDDGEKSGIADFPPDNDIVVLSQNAGAQTFLHELGHILGNVHTHQDGFLWIGDEECSDTIEDDPDWGPDDIARENFGDPYAALSPERQAKVDAVYHNIMSVHVDRWILTPCQLNQQSARAWKDRTWLLGREPVHVDPERAPGDANGSWKKPFADLAAAAGAGGLSGKAIVLRGGTHSFGPSLGGPDVRNVELIPRRGAVELHDPAHWRLPAHLGGASGPPALREGTAAFRDAEAAGDREAALRALERAEVAASGALRVAIRFEIAKRQRHLGNQTAASASYAQVAGETRQPGLRAFAAGEAERIRAGTRPGGW